MSLVIPAWDPPWPVDSTGGYVRITSTMMRGRGCAEQTARKARPDSFPSGDSPREPAGPGSFPLGLVRDAVLLLIGDDRPEARVSSTGELPAEVVRLAVGRAAEDSWQEWPMDSLPAVEAGVVGYLEVLESLRVAGELPVTRVFSDLVSVVEPATERIELWTWAIHHISEEGSVREVHLLRWRSARDVVLSEAELALIANVAADGFIAQHGKWYQRFLPTIRPPQPPPPDRVRVRVVGLLDSTSDLRFDGSPAQAHESFAALVPSHLGPLAGGSTLPSYACASCNVRYVCPGIALFPGVLGVAGFSPTTRSLSPSMLWTHGACPRQLFLARDLGLPRTRLEPSDALRRGTQVHDWLRHAHDRGQACSPADLPGEDEPGADSLHLTLGWSPVEYEANRPYLAQHIDVCPLARDGVSTLRSEIDITVWDTDANVVFTTRPDSAYLDADGAWVMRETKTLSPRGLPKDPTDLLSRYPQVAAAICLLADGYRPDTQPAEHPGRVELELLGPAEAAVVQFDAADPTTVLVARTALANRVDAWLFDSTHPIGEHPPCRTCEVSAWCDVQPARSLDDILDSASLASDRGEVSWHQVPDVVLREIVGSPAEQEEDFPF